MSDYSATEDHAYGPDVEPEITPENALVMIAHELRSIKRTLWHATFDPNCETTLDRIGVKLDELLSDGDDRGGVGDQLRRIADALESR